jgi:glutathione S-transferase
MSMTKAIKLYRHPLSGHCHRVETFLSLLKLPYELVEVGLREGEHKQPAFRSKNKLAQLPVIEDGDVTLADSNAILVYLALRYDASGRWLPREPLAAARIQRWLSIAAGELAYGPSALRRNKLLGAAIDRTLAEHATNNVFMLLQDALSQAPFLTGEQPTIADLALYAYTARAPEGGFSLDGYAAVSGWHARVEALPGFVPMQKAV